MKNPVEIVNLSAVVAPEALEEFGKLLLQKFQSVDDWEWVKTTGGGECDSSCHSEKLGMAICRRSSNERTCERVIIVFGNVEYRYYFYSEQNSQAFRVFVDVFLERRQFAQNKLQAEIFARVLAEKETDQLRQKARAQELLTFLR